VRARLLSVVVAGAVVVLGPVPAASAAPADVEVVTLCDTQLDRPEVADRDMKKQKKSEKKSEKRSSKRGVLKALPEVHTPDPDSDEDYRPLRGGPFRYTDDDGDGWDDSRVESRKSDRKNKKRFDTNNMSVDGALAAIC
jgi:hypothetical protein